MDIRKRYLELLRKSLVNELYIDNDARMLYLAMCAQAGKRLNQEVLQKIGLSDHVTTLRGLREDGSPWWNVPGTREGAATKVSMRNLVEFSHSMIGAKRMKNIEDCLDAVRIDSIPGDLAETGIWRGGATILMRAYLEAYEMEGRVVWAADSFEGLPPPTHPADQGFDFSAAKMPVLAVSLAEVQAVFERYGLLDERVKFLKGWFRDSLPNAPIEQLALLRVDGDLYESTSDSLVNLYDKVAIGGFILIDDYGDFAPCRQAVDDFRRQRGIEEPIEQVDWTGIYWRKAR